jgi:hypothetical protein
VRNHLAALLQMSIDTSLKVAEHQGMSSAQVDDYRSSQPDAARA